MGSCAYLERIDDFYSNLGGLEFISKNFLSLFKLVQKKLCDGTAGDGN